MYLYRRLRSMACVALLATPVALLVTLVGTASAQPTKLHEAPALAEQVKAGKLPPLSFALDACRTERPVLREITAGHLVRCHRAEELTLSGVDDEPGERR